MVAPSPSLRKNMGLSPKSRKHRTNALVSITQTVFHDNQRFTLAHCLNFPPPKTL
jgi:hypothetical protein